MQKLDDINAMTLTEYHYRMRAQQFIELKHEYERYKLAFAIRTAQATENKGTKKNPKEVYVFDSPDDVLNYEECYYRLLDGDTPTQSDKVHNLESNDAEIVNLIAEFNKKAK